MPLKKTHQPTLQAGAERHGRSLLRRTGTGPDQAACRRFPGPRRSARSGIGQPTAATAASAISSEPITSMRTSCGCITNQRSTRRSYSIFSRPFGCAIPRRNGSTSSWTICRRHKTPPILQWCRRNQVSPVFTATNASWMNRLECHLTAAHYFVIKNSDPNDHREVGQRIQEYLRWRNKNTDNSKLTKVQNSMPTL